MGYDVIEGDVFEIVKKARAISDLERASAELLKVAGLEHLDLAENSEEGSEQKGRLETAIAKLELAYQAYPCPSIANLLSSSYRRLGDIKKIHHMPGFEQDYTKSEEYEKMFSEISQG